MCMHLGCKLDFHCLCNLLTHVYDHFLVSGHYVKIINWFSASVVSAYEWSRELLNGSEVIRCAGEDVIFPWELKLNDSIEEFVGISWFQHKVGKDEIIIANYFNSDKRFTPSQSSVSQRLSQVICNFF